MTFLEILKEAHIIMKELKAGNISENEANTRLEWLKTQIQPHQVPLMLPPVD